MALYVKDREVGEMADRLAALKKTTKTEAVRSAHRSALAEDEPVSAAPPSADEEELTPGAKEILDFADALRAKYPAGGKGLPATKEWIDSLYED